jgi:AcrR family transcriptional regulator
LVEKNFQRWTAKRRAELVVDLLRGELTIEEACRKWELAEGDVRGWRDTFLRSGEESLTRAGRAEPAQRLARAPAAQGAVTFRKRPQRRTSQEIVEAIRQACLQILTEEGPDALSTNRIAKVAGVSIGSVYYYFPDKRAIVDVMYREELGKALGRNQENYRRTQLSHFSELSLPAALEHFITSALDRHRRMLRLDPKHYLEHLRDYDFDKILREIYPNAKTTEAWLEFLLGLHAAEVADDGNRGLKVFLAMRGLMGALKAVLEERPYLLQEKALSKELVTLILRYFRYVGDPSAEEQMKR